MPGTRRLVSNRSPNWPRCSPIPSQYDPGHEIPERSWAYRLAKRWWFNDYGTYTRHFDADNWRDTREQVPVECG